MDATPTTPYRTAAAIARAIATIATDSFGPTPETLRTLGDIARHLSAAADVFDAYEPITIPGLTGHDMPVEAAGELWLVEELVFDRPATRIPADITEYVKAPLTGRSLPFPDPLNPLNDRDTAKEKVLRDALEQLHADTARAAADVDGWMRDVLEAWKQHMRLAAAVYADQMRPCNQP
ncbi:hypothetical protein ACFU96_21335 [Streptomyces sp. NPDC057620]|uniref:hypothetical protein n=1 Tax=Streptomyces sp. NPDC057620 TaxID=3346185 RepID=UPI0036A50D10